MDLLVAPTIGIGPMKTTNPPSTLLLAESKMLAIRMKIPIKIKAIPTKGKASTLISLNSFFINFKSFKTQLFIFQIIVV